jgi:hypothetical protein
MTLNNCNTFSDTIDSKSVVMVIIHEILKRENINNNNKRTKNKNKKPTKTKHTYTRAQSITHDCHYYFSS